MDWDCNDKLSYEGILKEQFTPKFIEPQLSFSVGRQWQWMRTDLCDLCVKFQVFQSSFPKHFFTENRKIFIQCQIHEQFTQMICHVLVKAGGVD